MPGEMSNGGFWTELSYTLFCPSLDLYNYFTLENPPKSCSMPVRVVTFSPTLYQQSEAPPSCTRGKNFTSFACVLVGDLAAQRSSLGHDRRDTLRTILEFG